MNRAKLVEAGKKGGAAVAGVALIATGIGLIETGDPIVGAILAGLGALVILANAYDGKE